jgi:Ca-activated chloride channel family protein
MTFASPVWLAGLGLVPVAILASWLARRRAHRYAVRFPAAATAALAAGSFASLRRWLPAAFALAAIAALAFALARPHVSYSAPIEATSVMLVSDESGSMASSDVQPTRIGATEKAADSFIDQLPGNARVGAIAFSSAVNAVQAPSTDHGAAKAIIDGQVPNGATDTGDALALALQLLGGAQPRHQPAAIVLLSDGAANAGVPVLQVAQQAATEKIPIYTVALGTPNGVLANPDPFGPPIAVPPDPQLMQQIAAASHGREFDARTADELSSIYNHLGSKLATVKRKREVTAEFAVGGLVLLLFAAGLSTRFAPRLP